MLRYSGADPGFSVGRGAKPEGRQHTRFCQNFQNKYMKWRKFRAIGTTAPPLDPLLIFEYFLFDAIGYRLSTLWVNIPLSKRRYLPTPSYLRLQVNCL